MNVMKNSILSTEFLLKITSPREPSPPITSMLPSIFRSGGGPAFLGRPDDEVTTSKNNPVHSNFQLHFFVHSDFDGGALWHTGHICPVNHGNSEINVQYIFDYINANHQLCTLKQVLISVRCSQHRPTISHELWVPWTWWSPCMMHLGKENRTLYTPVYTNGKFKEFGILAAVVHKNQLIVN